MIENTHIVIIILLLLLIGLNVWDMYRRESFSSVGGNYFNVDYNTMDVKCDDLTGTDTCVVKTVKPKRKEVCTKKLNFISPTQRIQDMNARASSKNMKQLNRVSDDMDMDMEMEMDMEMGMSLDQIANDFEDDIQYSSNKQRENNNSKILNIIDNKKYKDNNTLSDIDEELISLN
jgi:hypothetical protein